jgi:type II secretory ATPase GspE/PulE/Tfp pilus assembly ATPase PilB-like protein
MFLCAYLDLLAQLPASNTYADPFKLAGILAVFTIWAYFAQWADKDTVAVNTYRELWNLVIMATGITGLALALFVPTYLIGFPAMAVIDLGAMIAYVVHRNRLVKPEDTVCTAAHFRRIQQEGIFGKKRKQTKEIKERVRLTGADHSVIRIPEDEIEREQYRLTQDLIFDTLWRRAAVLDITPVGQVSRLTHLIDGIATEREGMARPEADAVVLFLKKIAGLNLEERRKPQRGRIMAAIGDNRYKAFIETAGSTAGEKLRLRVLGAEATAKVVDLGFTPRQLEALKPVLERSKGLALLTGPPGAGLTTTVFAFARTHDAFLQNIQTLEYDREIEVDNVTQRLFTPSDDSKSFAAELQKLVRTDPDIIVFPELRERDAAALACQAAAEKIRMYIGLVAEDVFDALRKWTARVGDKALVAKCLTMITNQRLVRRLCSECKQPYKPDGAMLKKLNMPADAVLHRQPEPQFDKHGNPIICQACQGTGYVGRVGVFDVLFVDEELRQVIRTASSMSEVQTYAMKKGGLGLQAQAIQKVLDGTTSIQEVARVVRGGQASRAPGPSSPTAGPAPQPRPQPKAPTGK